MNTQELYQKTDAILARYGTEERSMIAVLQAVQEEYAYLPREVFPYLSERMGLSEAHIYGVATFYENFSLEPKGKHIIKVCDGTACHVRKSGPIYDAIYEYLKLDGKRRTSADGVFTLETVACLGACGLAPVMTVDGEVYAKMTPETALAELEAIRGKEAAE